MKVLGIDPSTHTGIAVVENKEVVYVDEINFPKKTGFDRVSAIVSRVFDEITTHQPNLIVLEKLVVGHHSSAIVLIELGSILRYFLWQEGIEYLDIPPATLKKFVIGRGNAKKEEVMMFVLKNWGFTPKTNNIADAVGLAMLGSCYCGEPGFLKPQERMTTDMKKAPGAINCKNT